MKWSAIWVAGLAIMMIGFFPSLFVLPLGTSLASQGAIDEANMVVTYGYIFLMLIAIGATMTVFGHYRDTIQSRDIVRK